MRLYDKYNRVIVGLIEQDMGAFSVYIDDQYKDAAPTPGEARTKLLDIAHNMGLSPEKQKKTFNA